MSNSGTAVESVAGIDWNFNSWGGKVVDMQISYVL